MTAEPVVTGYGHAQVEPRPENIWYKWRVWYFEPGKDRTSKFTQHRTQKAAEQRAQAFASMPFTSYRMKS